MQSALQCQLRTVRAAAKAALDLLGGGACREAVVAQVMAVQSAVDAAVALLAGEVPAAQVQAGEETSCLHPQDARQNLSTSGTERFLCGRCGRVYVRPFGSGGPFLEERGEG